MSIKIVCDFCFAESNYDLPKGWGMSLSGTSHLCSKCVGDVISKKGIFGKENHDFRGKEP